jgi:hypothetical protein
MSRRVLEIVTAVLLGLVSVCTAIGVHQASAWAAESQGFASVAQQARDRSLTLTLTGQLVLSIDTEIVFFPEKADELLLRQQTIISSASVELEDAWDAWADSGYDADVNPISTAGYETARFSGAHSQKYVYLLAQDVADRTAARAHQMVIASVVFAVALLLLGVSGVLVATRPALILAIAGAVFFVIGGTLIVGLF